MKGLSERCVFLGWRKDGAELLKAADIFILTSLWEGLPRSLVEALKTGLPAICYKSDGVADILKDGVNGYPIEKGDIENMYNKLKSLLENDDLIMRLSEGAARTDLKEFDIDFMVERLEGIYSL